MFQNNDYIETILLKAFQIFRLLSSVPTNGKCEHRLKLEKVSPTFSSFLRWPVPMYMRVSYVFLCFFTIFASLIDNDGTLRKWYLFSYRYKNF